MKSEGLMYIESS